MFTINKDSVEPAYLQLKQQIIEKIRSRQFPPGHRLPSIRKLSKLTGLACNTAVRAVNELVQEEIVENRIGVGNIVAEKCCRLIGITGYFQEQTFFKDNYYMAIMRGIHKVIDDRDIAFIFKQAKTSIRNVFLPIKPDGMILMGSAAGAHFEEEYDGKTDCHDVIIVGIKSSIAGLNYVDTNCFKAAFEGVKMLLEKGHRKIAGFFLDEKSERLNGYINALDSHGIQIDEKLLFFKDSINPETDCQQLLNLKPDAFFAAKGSVARIILTPIMKELCGFNRKPAILTFDPLENLISQYDLPYIYVLQPLEEIGLKAAEKLIASVEGNLKVPTKILLDPKLVVKM